MNSLPISIFFAARPWRGLTIRIASASLAAMGCVAATAATYTWDNGVYQNATDPTLSGTYFGTGQWSNRTNWVGPGTGTAAMSPSGGPAAGDDVVLNLYLDNPVAPMSTGSTSGTATNVLWFKNTTVTATNFINSLQFTGTSPKYTFNGSPIYSSTATATLPFNVLFVASDITMDATSGPTSIAQASGTVSRNYGIRPSGTSISFVNHSASAMTFGTPANTAFNPTTYVGGNATQTGFVFNGGTVSTGTATVVNITADGGGNIVFNNNVQNSTGGIRLVVNASNGGRVITKSLQVGLNGGVNPSIAINSGTLEFQGDQLNDSNFTQGIVVASGAKLLVNRPTTQTTLSITSNLSGAGALEVTGGQSFGFTASALNHTGGTVVSSGTLLIGQASSIAGNVTVSSGATFHLSSATTLPGVISGAGRVYKSGTSVTVLTGSNSFTGGIQIDSVSGTGALAMQKLNVSQLITGTGLGTLGVTGDGGATLDVSQAVAGGLAFRLGTPGSSDLVAVPGYLQIGSAALDYADFTFNPVSGFGAGTYTLFSATTALLGTLGSGSSGSIGGDYSGLLQTAGNTLQLVVTAVPEPSLAAVTSMAAAAGVLLLRQRRR